LPVHNQPVNIEGWWREWKPEDDRSPEQIGAAIEKQREHFTTYRQRRQEEAARLGITTAIEAHDEWLEDVQRPVERAVSLGWPTLDLGLGRPIGAGEVVVFAARTGVGKTFAALHVVARTLRQNEASSCLFLNLEMSRAEMAGRLVSMVRGVTPAMAEEAARAGLIEDGDEFARRFARFYERWHYPASSDLGTADLAKMLESGAAYAVPPTIVVVDYTGLLKGRGTTYERASENARTLKMIAKDANVTVLACVQVNRDKGGAGDKEPGLDALRDSGVIEEAADRIVMLWREADDDELEAIEGSRVFARLAKNRHGPRGARATLVLDASLRLEEVNPYELQEAS
jgi:replicative DNA helicase